MHYENLTAQQKLGYTDRCLWEEIGRNHDNETLDEPGWYQVADAHGQRRLPVRDRR